jgi:hypothetical protein
MAPSLFISLVTGGIESLFHHRPLKAPRPLASPLTPYKKAALTPVKHPTPPNSPPPTLFYAHAITISSRSSVTDAPPPHRRPSSGEQFPECAALSSPFSPPHGMSPRPRAASWPGSSELWPLATVSSMTDPWTGYPCAVHSLWTKPTTFYIQKYFQSQKISATLQITPCLSTKSSRSPQNSKKTPDFQKYIPV